MVFWLNNLIVKELFLVRFPKVFSESDFMLCFYYSFFVSKSLMQSYLVGYLKNIIVLHGDGLAALL